MEFFLKLCNSNKMKFKIYITLFLITNLCSTSLLADDAEPEIKLWKNFFLNMSAKDVVNELENFEHSRSGKSNGVKFKVDKKLEKKPTTLFGGVNCYDSIYQNEKIWVMGSSTYTQFCFDKPTERKNISSTNQLKIIHMKFHTLNQGLADALTSKYEFYNLDLTDVMVNGKKVPFNQMEACKGKKLFLEDKVLAIFDAGETLIFYSIIPSGYGEFRTQNQWLTYQSKEETLKAYKSRCISRVQIASSNDDI